MQYIQHEFPRNFGNFAQKLFMTTAAALVEKLGYAVHFRLIGEETELFELLGFVRELKARRVDTVWRHQIQNRAYQAVREEIVALQLVDDENLALENTRDFPENLFPVARVKLDFFGILLVL